MAKTEALLCALLAGILALIVMPHDLMQAVRLGAVQHARLEQGQFLAPR